jgi:small subunit ribosomal protein S1
MTTTESSQNSKPVAPDAVPASDPAAASAASPQAPKPTAHASNGDRTSPGSTTPPPADVPSRSTTPPSADAPSAPSEPGPHDDVAAAESTSHPAGDPADSSLTAPEHDRNTEAPAGAPIEEEGRAQDGSAPPEQSAQSETDGHGDKKRRRRRRKKKPGVQASGDAVAASEALDPSEGTSAPHAEEKPRDASGGEKREKKREKKHAQPRERPPVNVGDIVFGKILQITDEAILIDIPGKAHAIFDRREMLLLDDDDPKPAPATPSDEPGASALTASTVADDALEPAGAVETPQQAEVAADASTQPSGEQTPAVAEEHGAETPAEVPGEAAPPKDPKVPRVILEVGADFIGVVHTDGSRGGLVVLTHHPRRAERARIPVETAFNEKATIEGLVTGVIKGGIEVDVDGLRAFAPGSHVDLRLGADLSHLVAKRLPFFVTQYAKRGRDVVLSRRSILEEEAKKTRTDALARLKVGEDVDGIVRSVVPFGAFVDVGGIEGLVPLQEMSHNRADGPSDVFKAGEPTRVRVVKIDDKGKVWLSRRATIPDPWQEVARKYAQGTRHQGKVVRLQPFGAFVELESGVDGLIHMSDLSVKRIETPEEVVKVGDIVDVVVSHVDPTNHKIALHPAPQGDVANEAPQRVAPHKAVKAKVVTIESGGLIVRILGVTGRNARGYVTAAGTGTPRGTELRKAFHIGQELEAKVIEMDPRRGEIKLSIKALSEELERSAYQQYRQQLKAEAKFTFGDLLAKKKN